MEKFTKPNAERYIRNNNDAQVAQLGHLNKIVENINEIVENIENITTYKKYVAFLTQSGAFNPPVATVLENTLGVDLSYDYVSPGVYTITASAPIFVLNKTTAIQGAGNPVTFPSLHFMAITSTFSTLFVYPFNASATDNDQLTNQFIEIRVYN
jgi:hypothetical protein